MRQEYVTSMGQFVSQITPLIQQVPTAAPFMLKILQWAGASFSTSGGVETLFDNYIRAVEKQLQQPPPPDPEVAKQQAESQAKQGLAQQEGQVKQSLAQFDAQTKQALAGIEAKVKFDLAQLETASKERIAEEDNKTKLAIAEGKQMDLLVDQAQGLEERERDLETAKGEAELQSRASEMQIQHILDSAMLEIKKLSGDHELRVKESIIKARAETEKGEAKGEIDGMKKMHADLIKSVGEVVRGLQGLQSDKGKRSISITLPDGGKASAEVLSHRD